MVRRPASFLRPLIFQASHESSGQLHQHLLGPWCSEVTADWVCMPPPLSLQDHTAPPRICCDGTGCAPRRTLKRSEAHPVDGELPLNAADYYLFILFILYCRHFNVYGCQKRNHFEFILHYKFCMFLPEFFVGEKQLKILIRNMNILLRKHNIICWHSKKKSVNVYTTVGYVGLKLCQILVLTEYFWELLFWIKENNLECLGWRPFFSN